MVLFIVSVFLRGIIQRVTAPPALPCLYGYGRMKFFLNGYGRDMDHRKLNGYGYGYEYGFGSIHPYPSHPLPSLSTTEGVAVFLH